MTYDKALADYSEAIKLKPNEVRYYNFRAYIYEAKDDIQNSMAETEKSSEARSQQSGGERAEKPIGARQRQRRIHADPRHQNTPAPTHIADHEVAHIEGPTGAAKTACNARSRR